MPKTSALVYEWHDTPNIHLCTILDFVDLCAHLGIRIERRISLTSRGRTAFLQSSLHLANLFGEQAVFLVSKPQR